MTTDIKVTPGGYQMLVRGEISGGNTVTVLKNPSLSFREK